MYTGRTLFSQVMDFVPWTSFNRIVAKYRGDRDTRTLRCTRSVRNFVNRHEKRALVGRSPVFFQRDFYLGLGSYARRRTPRWSPTNAIRTTFHSCFGWGGFPYFVILVRQICS